MIFLSDLSSAVIAGHCSRPSLHRMRAKSSVSTSLRVAVNGDSVDLGDFIDNRPFRQG